jgi:hypothetical protein
MEKKLTNETCLCGKPLKHNEITYCESCIVIREILIKSVKDEIASKSWNGKRKEINS